ncbi:MAG: hypothetical protein J5760_00205 [Clostridia bacterium]|nr:hypothetical protein [Clostridia bacterium]
MEPKTKRRLIAVTGIIAALLSAVVILSFVTFSENRRVADYGKIREIVAANPRYGSSVKSSGFFSFVLKERLSSDAASEDSSSQYADLSAAG